MYRDPVVGLLVSVGGLGIGHPRRQMPFRCNSRRYNAELPAYPSFLRNIDVVGINRSGDRYPIRGHDLDVSHRILAGKTVAVEGEDRHQEGAVQVKMAANNLETVRREVEVSGEMGASLPDHEYQEQILQGVSRSFALTIPQLPAGLRSVVTNAYLLCRIADTIEDAGELPVEQKRFFFGEFLNVIRGKGSARRFSSALFPLLSGNTLPAERDLVRNMPRVIRITHGFNERRRAILERCVTIMSEGMLRFQEERNLHGLRGLGDLNKYCYHVAGVVGELLTELFCDYSEAIARRRQPLLSLAISFGQGLQMTNILKDLWDDEKRGACWLPRDIFQGSDCGGLSEHERPRAFSAGLSDLIGIAHAHLRNALSYSLLIPKSERGIRKFCLWAIGMALLTLQNINKRHDFTTGEEVKISRKTLKAVIIATNVALRSNCLVKKLFYLGGRGLPMSSVNS